MALMSERYLTNGRHDVVPHGLLMANASPIVMDKLENSSLYIGTIDGKDEERVAIGYSPAWSPNGTEIIFRGGTLDKTETLQSTQRQKRTGLSSSLSPRNQSGFGVPHGLRLAINSPFLGIIALRFGWKTSEYQRSIL